MTVCVDYVVTGSFPHTTSSWNTEKNRNVWEANLQHVFGVCSRPTVCTWMCLCRQPALLFTQINIWHWLHSLWSALHPIWTINISAIRHFVSMDTHGAQVSASYNPFTIITLNHCSIIVSLDGLNKKLHGETAYIHWHTCIIHFHYSPSLSHPD